MLPTDTFGDLSTIGRYLGIHTPSAALLPCMFDQ